MQHFIKSNPGSRKNLYCSRQELQVKELLLAQWRRTLFLREESIENRGWLIEAMRCTENIGKSEFSLEEVYAFDQRPLSVICGGLTANPRRTLLPNLRFDLR